MKELLPQIVDQIVIPLLSAVIPILLTAIVAWLGKKAANWFDLKQEDAARKTLESALQNAANLIVQGTKNLAGSAAYVNSRVPDALHTLDLKPEQVADMVSARVPAARVAEVIPEATAPVIKVPEPATPAGT